MRNFQKVVALIALSGMCMAAPAPSDGDPSAKKSTRHRHHAVKPVKRDEQAEKLRALKETVDQQQAALQQMQQQVQQQQQQLQATQAQLQQTQQTAQQADAKIATVETNSNLQVQRVQSDLSDVKTALDTTTVTVQKDEKKVVELEHPNSVAYKGIRITPAGFVEATGYFRSKATLSDQATPFQTIPLEHFAAGTYAGTEASANPNLTETGFTPRDSRIAFRIDADPSKSAKLAAYYEMDFLSASSTANPNQTSSYTPRIRQAWARVKFDNGWTITGGQMWSLLTLNRKGTDADNANVWIPNIIEAQYSIGYDWGRFGAVRVSKTLGKSVNFALELNNASSLTQANNTTTGIAGLASTGNGLDANSLVSACTTTDGVTTCTNTPTYSTNLAPDMIAKLTYDSPTLGHFEVKGVGRFFRDRVIPTATTPGWNNTALGGGVGAGWVIPVVSKKIDFITQGMYGKGISRYQDAGQYDFVVRSTDHNLQPIKAFSALAGFETHPSRKTEFDVLFGEEYYYRTLYVTSAPGAATTTLGGYGVPTATNTGCYFENLGQYQQTHPTATALPACTGNNRVLWNGKVFGYYDLFKGPHGTLRYGAEYDYDFRQTWSGNGGLTAGSKGLTPKGTDNTAFVTMRYILP
jgi:DNA-binding protein YbaB